MGGERHRNACVFKQVESNGLISRMSSCNEVRDLGLPCGDMGSQEVA